MTGVIRHAQFFFIKKDFREKPGLAMVEKNKKIFKS